MILLKSKLNCIDNTGAMLVECIKVLGADRAARVGDRIVCVVQRARPIAANIAGTAAAANKVKRGDIRHAVIVRTRKQTARPDGSYARFDDNACVLISKTGEPLGTRVTGVVASELRKGYSKIMSLAEKII